MKSGKQIGNVVWKNIVILLVGTLVALIALWLVYQLPIDPMRQHVAQSMPMLREEFLDSELIDGYKGTLTGNFTDCLMLEHAIYENTAHSTLEQMLLMYRAEVAREGWAPGDSLYAYLNKGETTLEVEYSRYWHGYLVILKPLLMLTTVNSLRLMSATLQLMLISAVVLLCAQKKETLLGVAFVVSLPFMYFSTMFFSLSLSICFYLLTVVLICLITWHKGMEKKKWYPFFFLIVGMMTAYFDFLTYPLVTLCFPLCTVLYLGKDKGAGAFCKMMGYSTEWGVGYGGLWAMKWLVTDLLVGGHSIEDALGTIGVRMDTADQKNIIQGFVYVLKLNLDAYFNWGILSLSIGILVGLAVWVYRKKSVLGLKETFTGCLPILLVGIFPFIWFFFTQNHSEQHYMFTFKILSASVFALVCAVGKLVKKDNE